MAKATEATEERTWKGDEEALGGLLVPLADLRQHPENPRKGSVERISESLQQFGQTRPIVATREGVIVAGNHTYQAATKLGWTHVAAVKIEMSETQARAYLVADNRLSDIGTYEEDLLSDLLGRLQDDGLLDGTGWTLDEVEDFQAEMGDIDITPVEEFEGGYAETEEEYEERAKRPEGSSVEPLREVVLMYRPAEYEAFGKWVAYLEKIFGTRGSVATVYETIKRSAEREGYEGGGLDTSDIPDEDEEAA